MGCFSTPLLLTFRVDSDPGRALARPCTPRTPAGGWRAPEHTGHAAAFTAASGIRGPPCSCQQTDRVQRTPLPAGGSSLHGRLFPWNNLTGKPSSLAGVDLEPSLSLTGRGHREAARISTKSAQTRLELASTFREQLIWKKGGTNWRGVCKRFSCTCNIYIFT